MRVETCKLIKFTQGTTLTFAATCPIGQVRFSFSLALLQLSLALEKLYIIFYNISFKSSRTCWHVKAYFLGQAWIADHEICTHSQK